MVLVIDSSPATHVIEQGAPLLKSEAVQPGIEAS